MARAVRTPPDTPIPPLHAVIRRSISAMWLRRAYYGWLIPAAFLLPLWLLVGWAVFRAGGWAFLWTLFLAIPAVFIGQLVLTLLVRARGTVRSHRAVSWWDVLGFTVWHALIIALGFFNQAWWAPVMIVTILVGVGLFWLDALAAAARGQAVGHGDVHDRGHRLRAADGIPAGSGPSRTRSSSSPRSATPTAPDPGFGGPGHPWQNGSLCPDQALPQGSPSPDACVGGLGHTNPFPSNSRSTCGGRRET